MWVPHFTGFHIKFWCAQMSFVSLHRMLCRHTVKAPLLPLSLSQTYNILSLPPPSSLIYILIHCKRDLLWWQCSHILTLRTISPCLKFTEAGSVIFDKTLQSLQNRVILPSSSSLGLFIVKKWLILLQNFTNKNVVFLKIHSSLASGILEKFRIQI